MSMDINTALHTPDKHFDRLKDIIDCLDDAVILSDPNYVILANNSACKVIYGFGKDELVGRQITDLIPEDDELITQERIRSAPGERWEGDVEWIHKSGHRVRVRKKITFLRDLRGNILGRVSLAKHIPSSLDAPESEISISRLVEENEVISEIGAAISSSFDIGEAFDRFAAHVKAIIPYDCLCAWTYDYERDESKNSFVAGERIQGLEQGITIPLVGSPGHLAISTRMSMKFDEKPSQKIQNQFSGYGAVARADLQSNLFIPLVSNNLVVGNFCISSYKPNSYTQRQVALAERLGAQLAGAIVSSQLHEQIKKEANQRETLARIGRIMSSSLDIEDVYERFTEEVRELIPFDRITIATFDYETRTVTHEYVVGPEIAPYFKGTAIPMKGTHSEEVARSRAGLLILTEDESDLASRFPGMLPVFRAGMRSFMSVPINYKDEVIGVLTLRSQKPNAYSNDDMALAERVSDQIAGAITSARMHIRLQDAAREQELLAEISRVVSSSADIFEVIGPFIQRVDELIPSDSMSINIADTERGTISSMLPTGLPIPGRGNGDVAPLKGSVTAEVMRRRQGILLQGDSMERMPIDFPAGQPSYGAGVRSILSAPLVVQEKAIGALHLQSLKENAYNEHELRLAGRIASQIAGAIANSQLNSRLEQQAKEWETLARIGIIISSTLDIEEIYERCADQIRTLIPFDRIAFSLLDMDSNTTRWTYNGGVNIPEWKVGATSTISDALEIVEVIQTKAGLIAHGEPEGYYASQYPLQASSVAVGLKSMLVAPLISNDEVIGILALKSRQANAYTQHDLELAERIGTEVAGAIVNTQLYAQQIEAEEALRQSEARFRAIFEDAAIGIALVGLDGNILDCNQSFQKMIGYSVSELRDVNFADITYPEDLDTNLELYSELKEGKRSQYQLEKRYITKENDVIWTRLTAASVRDSAGALIFTVAMIEDVTGRRELEQQLLQYQKIEAVGQLAGGVAHDFNNVLTPIISYAQLAANLVPDKSRPYDYMQEILKAADRASNLTRQLLAFSRRQIIEPRVLSLNDLILDMDRMLRRLISEDIELAIIPSTELGMVRVDPSQMEQVLINLVVNARDAMPNGGKVVIATNNVTLNDVQVLSRPQSLSDDYVLLTVADTGTGMEETVKSHIFEPFFTTKEPGKGTGLGLATCYGIVTQNGGHIAVESELGKGTIFNIYIPRNDSIADALPIRDDSGYLPVGRERILLAEDEPMVRQVAAYVLREQGYEVIEASNGLEALRIADEHNDEQIHLLLTDVVMPLMGGKDLSDRLKEKIPSLKVLYTSGYTDDAIVHRGVLEPGTEFMHKPFTPSTLARRVRDVLDKSEPSLEPYS